MPHIPGKRYAVVSCHVERPLDDRAWATFSRLQERRPGGFRIAALMRPPDAAAGEDEQRWVERARQAAVRAPFGLHTHWTSPTHARPSGGDPVPRVREQVAWLRECGLEPRFFVGGGWYADQRVRSALSELGLVDCTATAFRPSYLAADAAHLELKEPSVVDGVLVLPATHSLGMLARGVLARLPRYVHAYFHDTDLLRAWQPTVLAAALRVLARRREPADLETAAVAEARPR
jgi:hypothetical protein